MKWNQSKSVTLSKLCVILFALLLLVVDVGCHWGVRHLISETTLLNCRWNGIPLIAAVYSCSIPAWITLWSLWKILARIGRDEVFVEENVQDMRKTSWCCFFVGMLCLASAFFYPTLLVVSAAAAFMGLIVRIVKNVFQQAVSMKDELDFTV